jgi:methionyl-tRNA formyltransferase
MQISYGILSSGNLGLQCLVRLHKTQKINFVFTDTLSNDIIIYCKDNNIPLFVGNPRAGKSADFLNEFSTDVILSINYLFIIEEDIISHAKMHAINLHGSCLPKYRGRTPHVWAIINNEKETGITAHSITLGCDEGDIVYQEIILIEEDITGAGLLNRYNERYPLIIDELVSRIEKGLITYLPQDNTKATWFGKRTPEDGIINWNWQKERIYNWVRAQAKPYPGAFSYYKNEKLIIHKIEYSEHGFKESDENGLILDIVDYKVIVKTPNGAISIVEYEFATKDKIAKGEKLS